MDHPGAQATAADAEALALRRAGKSYATIAKTLGYERPMHAVEAFHRELRRRPDDEQATLRQQELDRLDALAEKTRGDTAADDGDGQARRLRTIEALRQRLLAS